MSTRRTASGFDHASDAQAVFETSDEVRVISSFDQLGLKEDLVRGIYAYSRIMCYWRVS